MCDITTNCKLFIPNIFDKNKCQSCFRIKNSHSMSAIESNKALKKPLQAGYLLLAPTNVDFSNSDNKVDTVPQGMIDLNRCERIVKCEAETGQENSLAIVCTSSYNTHVQEAAHGQQVHYVATANREEMARWNAALQPFSKIGGMDNCAVAGQSRSKSLRNNTANRTPDRVSLMRHHSSVSSSSQAHTPKRGGESDKSKYIVTSNMNPPESGGAAAAIAVATPQSCAYFETDLDSDKAVATATLISNVPLKGAQRSLSSPAPEDDLGASYAFRDSLRLKKRQVQASESNMSTQRTVRDRKRMASASATASANPSRSNSSSVSSSLGEQLRLLLSETDDVKDQHQHQNVTQSTNSHTYQYHQLLKPIGVQQQLQLLENGSNSLMKFNTAELNNMKKGWLYKQSLNDINMRKFWCVLSDGRLRFYLDGNAEDAGFYVEELDMRQCLDVRPTDSARHFDFQIQLDRASRDIVHLSAMTAAIRHNWIEALQKWIHKNDTHIEAACKSTKSYANVFHEPQLSISSLQSDPEQSAFSRVSTDDGGDMSRLIHSKKLERTGSCDSEVSFIFNNGNDAGLTAKSESEFVYPSQSPNLSDVELVSSKTTAPKLKVAQHEMDLAQRLAEAQVTNADLLRQRTQLELRLDENNRTQLALEKRGFDLEQQLLAANDATVAKHVEVTELSELCRRLKSDIADKESQLSQCVDEGHRIAMEIDQVRRNANHAQQLTNNKLLLADAQMRQDKRLLQELRDKVSQQEETIEQLKMQESASRRRQSGELQVEQLRAQLEQCAQSALEDKRRNESLLEASDVEFCALTKKCGDLEVQVVALQEKMDSLRTNLSTTQQCAAVAADTAHRENTILQERCAELASLAAIDSASGVSELAMLRAELERRNADLAATQRFLDCAMQDTDALRQRQASELGAAHAEIADMREVLQNLPDLCLEACGFELSQITALNLDCVDKPTLRDLWNVAHQTMQKCAQRAERLRCIADLFCASLCPSQETGQDFGQDIMQDPADEEAGLALLERCAAAADLTIRLCKEEHGLARKPLLSARIEKALAYVDALQQRLTLLDRAIQAPVDESQSLLASLHLTHLEQELAHMGLKCVLIDNADVHKSATQFVDALWSDPRSLPICSELLSKDVVQATQKWLDSSPSPTPTTEIRRNQLKSLILDCAARQTLLCSADASLEMEQTLSRVAALVEKTGLVQLDIDKPRVDVVVEDESTLNALTSQAEMLTLRLAELMILVNGAVEEHTLFVCSALDALTPIFYAWARTALEQLFPAQLRCTAAIFSDLREAASECKLSFVDEDELLRTYLLSLSNKLVGQLLQASDLQRMIDKRSLHDVVRSTLAGLADEIMASSFSDSNGYSVQPLPDAVFNKQVRKAARATALLSFSQYCLEERTLPQRRQHIHNHTLSDALVHKPVRQHDSGISLLGSPPPPPATASHTDEVDADELQQQLQLRSLAFEDEKVAFQRKLQKKRTQLTDCQQRLAGAELLLADLRLEKSSQDEQMEQFVLKLAACEKINAETVARHQDDVTAAEERYQLLKTTFTKMKQQLRESEGQIQELRQELSQVKEVHAAAAALLVPKEENVQLMAKCEQLQKRIDALREDYEAELDRQRTSHKRLVCQLREEKHAAAKDEVKVKHVGTQALLSNLFEGDLVAVQVLCQASVDAVEECQSRTLAQLNAWYKAQIELLRQEKDAAIRAESQATQVVLDALRHSHEAELLSEKRRLDELLSSTYSEQEVDIFLEQYRLDLALIRKHLALLAEQLVLLATAKVNSPDVVEGVITRLTDAAQRFTNGGAKEPSNELVAVLRARLERSQKQMALLRLRFAERDEECEIINVAASIDAVELAEFSMQTEIDDDEDDRDDDVGMPSIAEATLDRATELTKRVVGNEEEEVAVEKEKNSSQESLLEMIPQSLLQDEAHVTLDVANENMEIDASDDCWPIFSITSQVPLSHFYLGETVPLSDSSNKSASSHHLNEERPVICTQATSVYRRKRDNNGSEGGKNRPKSTLF